MNEELSAEFWQGTRDCALRLMADSVQEGKPRSARKYWQNAVGFNRSMRRQARREERLARREERLKCL